MNNIILIGFMGCGKTSVGKRLAGVRNMEFMDTDQLIAEEEKKSIAEIFEKEGEGYFRSLETRCLEKLKNMQLKNAVLSVGGGLPLREENRELLKEIGTVIYLQVSPDTVYKRLANDTTRPLLMTENPRGRIADLLNRRRKFYEAAADVTLSVDNKSFEDILKEIDTMKKEQ